MIIIIKNHKGKISIEFPESVNIEKSYFTKNSLRSEAILLACGMVWYPQDVPEKVLGTSSILTGAKFYALFSANFCKTIFIRRSSRVSFFGAEERREEKIVSGYARVISEIKINGP